ncbi:hypothetical protein [Catalinimonas niigatensis]|uniref:hypothetical protein n=1 Tax=Catalinimonas niigatensis TaxID=1397264 RepID=UPI00266522C3|nr:hypothetical protein [Catalinimonas niigatensis]WPP52361.1 hypothetical protein PZB72_08200 [Catalinimonas niigatensis]
MIFQEGQENIQLGINVGGIPISAFLASIARKLKGGIVLRIEGIVGLSLLYLSQY